MYSKGNAENVRQFLGLTGFYRRFIRHYAKIALPLYRLTRDQVPRQWGAEEQRAFEELKRAVASAPTLVLPDHSLDFQLNTDASDFAIGAVLSQDRGQGLQPVAFASRKLNSAERNYPTYEKELLAVVWALQHFRHYLDGKKVLRVATDHSTLRHLLTQPKLSARRARWFEQLAEFNIDIQHVAGKLNFVADALSRRPDYVDAQSVSACTTGGRQPQANNIIVQDINPDFLQILLDAYATEPHTFDSDADVRINSEGLYVKQVGDNRVICIPGSCADLIKSIISNHHDQPWAVHPGIGRTLSSIQRFYYWPRMDVSVAEYVAHCDVCQRVKHNNKRQPGLLQPLPIPEKPWQHIQLDIITHLPEDTAAKYNCILTVVDRLTKMAHFIPCKVTDTAEDVFKHFMSTVFRLHGLPESILSDNDTRFTSTFWRDAFDNLGVKLLFTSAYHPQTDGLSERTTRTIVQLLRAMVLEHGESWVQALPYAEFAYNNTASTSTGFSAFFLNAGQHPRTPGLHHDKDSQVPSVHKRLELINRTIQTAMAQQMKAQQRQKGYADRFRRRLELPQGSWVLLSTKPSKWRQGDKLREPWIGPYKIRECLGPTTYRLRLPVHMHISDTWHVSHLKPYRSESEPVTRPLPDITQEIPPRLAERIVDHRWIRRGMRLVHEYLVHWLNRPTHDRAWVREDNLSSCRHLIDAYTRQASNVGP